MATPWWAKVNPDFYKKESGLHKAVAPQSRRMRAVLADTRLRDEPQIAGAFMRAGVPIPLAQRADIEYRKIKAGARQEITRRARMPEVLQPRDRIKIGPLDIERPDPQANIFEQWMQATGNIAGEVVDANIDIAKGIGKGILEVANAAFSPLTVPVAAWRANEEEKPETDWRAVNEAYQSGRPIPGPTLGGADIQRQFPLSKAIDTMSGARPVTDTQAQDMRSQGYDPGSFVSRYSYYYSSMEAGQRAVPDSDVRYFEQEFDPGKVQAVREIIVSDALNTGDFSALSPATQRFVEGLQAGEDPRDAELFERMNKSSTLHLGSIVSDGFGIPRGSDASLIVSSLADLALYWYADPIYAGVKGLQAYRMNQYGFTAGSLAAAENKLLALREPGNLDSKPATAAGSAMNEVLKTSEQVVRLTSTPRATPAEQAAAMNEAARIMDRFRIRHPEMMGHLDAVTRFRTGQLDTVRFKSDKEAEAGVAAAANGKPFSPYFYVDPDKPGKPIWQLADDGKGGFTERSLNESRAAVVKRMSDYIWAESIQNGRPLNRGLAMLPGEVAVNRRIRARIEPIRNALLRTDQSIYKAFDDTKGVVKFDATFDRAPDIQIQSALGDWTAANYTGKWSPTLEKMLSRIDVSYSGKKFTFEGAESTELYRRFVISMFPRHLAYAMAIKWAKAGPGERMAQWRQTVDAFVHAANFKSDAIAREITDRLTKGVVPRVDEPHRVGPNEIYGIDAADNVIKADGHEIAAAIWPYQLSDGVTLPNLRAIREVQQKTGLLSAVTGMFNSRLVTAATSVWKVGKVGNLANMFRQAGEGGAMSMGDQGFQAFTRWYTARAQVAAENAAAREARNTLHKASKGVSEQATGHDLDRLNKFFQAGDFGAYRAELEALGRAAGLPNHQLAALADLAEGIKFEDLLRLGPFDNKAFGNAMVTLAGPLDMLRRLRAANPPPAVGSSRWQQWVDQAFLEGQTRSAIGEFGMSAEQYAMMHHSVRDAVTEAAQHGVTAVPARTPNSRQLLGAAGDVGARNWYREFDSRQTDVMGNEIMRAIAIDARAHPNARRGPGQILNNKKITKGRTRVRAGAAPPVYPPHVQSVEDVARYLLVESDVGKDMRNRAMRAMYDASGGRVIGDVERIEALHRIADVQIREAVRHMGGKLHSGVPVFPLEYTPILTRLVNGGRVRLDDLASIPDDLRPPAVSTPLYVPGVKPDKKNIVNMAGKLYNFTVARPLQQLSLTPMFIANRKVAYDQLGPAADALLARGLSEATVGTLLETIATRAAVRTTFRYTDNALERSMFSELTENFLMFQRAAEDFIKRFMQVTSANPAVLSRGYLLMEAAQHSGMIYPDTSTDDEGNQETHLVFTFPGSGIMAKAVQEAGQALGWNDSDLIVKPLYSSMSSQLRFVNPSLSNPLGFSATPLIGMPLRFVRSQYPETDKGITNFLARIEGGGERFFAEQSIIQSLLPTPLARAVPAITQDDEDGQLASAIRNAFIYYGAAGLLPGNDSTAEEREEAHDAIVGMANNQLIWRAALGFFSPWAPRYNEPEFRSGTSEGFEEGIIDAEGEAAIARGDIPPVMGPDSLPEANVLDQARGINSLRGEWFEILRVMSEKHGSTDAYSHAAVEWARRYPRGESIIEPSAFLVGTTRAPFTDESNPVGPAMSYSSGPLLTEWMMNNRDWLKANKTVAFYLLPQANEAQYTSAGQREQLRNGLRVHKGSEEFYRDVRYQLGVQEFYARLDIRNRDLAAGHNRGKVYDDFNAWKKGWETAHPATAAEMARRQNPDFVHGELAPSLKRLIESGTAPKGVPIGLARDLWEHYSDYREKYNKTGSDVDSTWDRIGLNSDYRDSGNAKFLGTEVERLWKAFDVYEVN